MSDQADDQFSDEEADARAIQINGIIKRLDAVEAEVKNILQRAADQSAS
ncbi:MAG: hypothetical protein WA417_04275 [Stellaceae bacterium]